MSRTEYNYFLSEDGSGCGAIRVTDIYGERLTVSGLGCSGLPNASAAAATAAGGEGGRTPASPFGRSRAAIHTCY
ncbi:hypothetical protein [Micromonospora sp. NPDC050276]|uniref:hypothetical protein n=1 Tax=Micromonospora sp. NPDC050276 TaxID=3364278 RepID=UPI0037B4E147